nr:hypothetical protein [Tanacetum cinerariifolium]
MVVACDPQTCWCSCIVDLCSLDIQNLFKDFSIDNSLPVGQKEFIRSRFVDLFNCVPELLHKDFRNICKDSECLEAHGILDYVNDHLKCFFLLRHNESYQMFIKYSAGQIPSRRAKAKVQKERRLLMSLRKLLMYLKSLSLNPLREGRLVEEWILGVPDESTDDIK